MSKTTPILLGYISSNFGSVHGSKNRKEGVEPPTLDVHPQINPFSLQQGESFFCKFDENIENSSETFWEILPTKNYTLQACHNNLVAGGKKNPRDTACVDLLRNG